VPVAPQQQQHLTRYPSAPTDRSQTNIALFGSDVEKQARQACGGREPAWANAGKAPGLQIWRIEQFKVVPVPPTSYGCFYKGDSYIVLSTTRRGNALAWDIHFWLGSETTQDEAGTAAYKTVELDDYLGGAPVQHREVQDHESQLFLSYFPRGICLMDGGMQSGFRHVEARQYTPRLLQLKGKRNVRLRQVPLGLASLNSGDVFVLDLGLSLLQFNGRQSAPQERSKAAEICRVIASERGGATRITVFEEDDAEWPQEWLNVLGRGPIATAEQGGSDEAFDTMPSRRVLYRLSDASGSLQVSFVAQDAAVRLSMLDPADAFIFDAGNEVFAWIGQGASAQECRQGLAYAQMYVRDNGLDPAIPISRVMGGHESAYFLKLFQQ